MHRHISALAIKRVIVKVERMAFGQFSVRGGGYILLGVRDPPSLPSRRLILYLPSLVVFLKATFCYDVNSPLADRAKSAPSPVGHAILEEDACYKDRGLWNCNVECRLVGLAGAKRGQSSASGALGPPR